jgi:hypothetical protein
MTVPCVPVDKTVMTLAAVLHELRKLTLAVVRTVSPTLMPGWFVAVAEAVDVPAAVAVLVGVRVGVAVGPLAVFSRYWATTQPVP